MSVDLVLMLSAAAAGGLLAHALRLPPMVGFLVAGFAMAGAGVTGTSALDALAELGVVLLLFAIGLKFDVRVLVRREVLGVGAVHALLSIGLVLTVLATAGALGLRLLAGVEVTDLLLVALALSFSSTVVAVKVLEEQNATRSLHGRTTIGILVVQDLVAVAALAVVEGEAPSWWAPLLLLLVPASWLVRRMLDGLDHGELLTLVGITLALVPGYALFDAAGLKGDLGALAVGVLLAPSSRAEELAKSIFSVKELLQVAFFLSVGLHGAPDPSGIALALALVALVPLKAVLFALLLRASGFRVRTATRAAASLGSFSEFALIVVVAATAADAVDREWLATISTAVAMSFVVASVTSAAVDLLSSSASRRVADPARLHPEERPIDLGRADALVLGMGRLGRAASGRLVDTYGLRATGVDSDATRVDDLRAEGLHVVEGDATDPLFWARVSDEGTVRLVVLAMPFHGSNVAALDQLRRSGFGGAVTAVTRYDEEVAHLAERAAVVGLYDAAGAELADQAVRAAGPDPGIS
ncbi:cation:proton antiporter [Nocardioides sp. zg-1230]|uniref:cation:proton antiporter domain-containing protein n=1 Tax=Nocardioides sp. zg-1230 TaxID=2736601 RepID=UPI001554A54E|nr:cation:proton antiporter [Nocardioides sp. zg-1230]NPC43202.1 potassium transporter Kef [Nocardioides sp. zg-1230]NPC44894.1 potassium transporter Kef [Nocardioides sp. zg-1230]